ncbi:MAG: prolyl oligopeptidase family serine peptidase, partial [Flavobacteriales bacterium]|nr:prolyl oligopeptidase family serine peptidase [Flavobacteriales bacterium]
KLPELNYGIVVSCPGVTLLESDLNYWKNSNSHDIGDKIDEAVKLQGDVFRFIAGTLSKTDLEKLIKSKQDKVWFKNIWIPNLDEVKIDKKLLYSPIPYFKKVKQPILIVQGTKDNIIPIESSEIIAEALKKANNNNFEVHFLKGASHAMNNVDESDFPYWSKLHSNYIETLDKWMSSKN